MRLIDENRIAAGCYSLAPSGGLRPLGLRRLFIQLGASHVAVQPLHDEGKLLQGGDDDLGLVYEGVSELLRILVDGLDDALSVFDLIDSVLQLMI